MLSLLRSASLEGVGSMIIVWFFGMMMTSMSTNEASLHGNIYLSFAVATVVTLLVRILGPLTGGHLNPIVTLSLCITGLTPPMRGLAYFGAQMTGATLGGLFVALSLGPRAVQIDKYGCYFNSSANFNAFHASVFEFMGTICVISMMYGFGTTNRAAVEQGGERISPLLNGITLGLFVFAASGFAPEKSYLGTIGFPTRCWASSIGVFKFTQSDWIFWIPSILGATLHGLAYRHLKPFLEEDPAIEENSYLKPDMKSSMQDIPGEVIIKIGESTP